MFHVLILLDRFYPTRQAFLEEVYTRDDEEIQSWFLMRSPQHKSFQVESWNKSNVYVYPYKTNIYLFDVFCAYFFDPRVLYYFIKLVKKHSINIIHIRNRTFPLFLGLLLRPFFDYKIVYQKSHPVDVYRIRKALGSKSRFGLARVRYYLRILDSKLLHKLLPFCDAVLPITSYMGNNLTQNHGVPQDKIVPFGMGIHPDNLRGLSRTRPALPEEKWLIYVGDMKIERQLENLIKAIQILIEKKCSIRLSMVGGSSNEVTRLKNIAKDYGVKNYVKFYGYVDREKVYQIIREHDIGVSYIPQDELFVDASPTKLMEYLGVGLPVVATDCIFAHFDILKQTKAGLLTSTSAHELANAIEEIVKNFPKYQRLGEEARSYIYKNYNYKLMQQRLVDLFAKLSIKVHPD